MSPPLHTTRDPAAVRRLLQEQTLDVRGLDREGFRRWLAIHINRWQSDPVFVQRALIRDLRRAHPRLGALEAARRRVAAEEEAEPRAHRLRVVEREWQAADRAVAGLTAALGQAATPERRSALQRKLNEGLARRQAAAQERDELIRSSPRRQDLLRLDHELQSLRAAAGLDVEEARLAELLRGRGHRSVRSGAAFEARVVALCEAQIVPELRGSGNASSGDLRVLSGVRLGAAGVEFDQLVVRVPGSGLPVEVLAAVEAKRNINDLGHGFRRRQADLTWLTGDKEQYDPGLYRTHYFLSGHFDRGATHSEGGESYLFGPDSFRHFARDRATGLFLDRLYFVTRPGPLWGLSAAALGRVGRRAASDPAWHPEDDNYLDRFRLWCQGLAQSVEAPDVLRHYAATAERGRLLLLLDPA